eukprot:COSAG06_NODE_651_length_13384_cov_2.712382_4_plen_430_part_00
MPSDDVSQELVALLVQLLRSQELPELAIAGAWRQIERGLTGRPGLAPMTMELGLHELGVEHLRAIGSPADAVSILRGKAGRALAILSSLYVLARGFAGQKERPDFEACVASGTFDVCVEIARAFALAGLTGIQDTDHSCLFLTLSVLAKYGTQDPSCEAKIRGLSAALAFCLENSLEYMHEIGYTTGGITARVCCNVFGRDEGGCEFSFTPQHIETLTEDWSQNVRATGYKINTVPSADSIFAAQLCTSDANKPLLMANHHVLPYLVDALLLDPDHPRAGMKEEQKIWCQEHHCEALLQLAVHKDSRAALLRDQSVVPALEAVAQTGMSQVAREQAAAALVALSDKVLVMLTEGSQKHVMLSYQWEMQATIQRTNESLIARGYATWFDLTNMKGSTMDAMSNAIEGADVMLYGVSLAYKESANCRLEAS